MYLVFEGKNQLILLSYIYTVNMLFFGSELSLNSPYPYYQTHFLAKTGLLCALFWRLIIGMGQLL